MQLNKTLYYIGFLPHTYILLLQDIWRRSAAISEGMEYIGLYGLTHFERHTYQVIQYEKKILSSGS